jgi:DNA-binding transcriptional LysR family regulator
MPDMHEYLKTAPFDIYELHLFHLVAQHRSFTRAAAAANLTQSAVTRQVKNMETSLGLALFERTTRTVKLTPAGQALWRESVRLVGDIAQILKSLREEFTDAKKEIRVGVSRSVGLAYLPGFFHANLRRLPQVGYRVSSLLSAEIFSGLDANELDVGVLSPPRRLPATVRITHRFTDGFALIGSPEAAADFELHASTRAKRIAWMNRQGCRVPPGMQLDNFDLIINLAALGMGVSFVPVRALALYSRKRTLRRLPWPERFERELVVAVRRNRQLPGHIFQFIENVLF